MTVRKLKSDDLDVVDLNLTLDQAVLLFEYKNGNEDYILITKYQENEPYLMGVNNVSGVRFIGAEEMFLQLESNSYPWVNKVKKKVTFKDNMLVMYYPNNVKISFDKLSDSSIETFC
jgi:hypothetical protein